MKLDNKVLLVGGGTAGHVLPLLAVTENLKEANHKLEFVYFGSGSAYEKREVIRKKIRYQKILSGKWRRNYDISVVARNLFDLCKVVLGIIQSIFFIKREKPDLILSKGGFVSVPVSIAAGWLKIPLIIHESDVQLGLANRIALKYAVRIGTAFPVKMYPAHVCAKAFYSGVPLRQEFIKNNYRILNRHLLLIGGSQGAEKINKIFFAIGLEVLKKHRVVHITGAGDINRARTYRESLPYNLRRKYQVLAYTPDIARLIAQSKLVISRAGASTIFEIAAFGKKAIFIPISESVAPHQLINATVLAKSKLAHLFLQTQKPEELLSLIDKAIKSDIKLRKISFIHSTEAISTAVLDQLESQKLKQFNQIHLIGIGGVSMKGLKYLLEKMKKKVFGSDLKSGGHSAKNIGRDTDLVVYSSAITAQSQGFIEIKEAQKRRLAILKRSQMIGLLMKGKNGISITGMHGKTTISMMVSRIFELDGRDPTYLIGAPNSDESPAYRFGAGSDFVAEACEYDDSFLDFSTTAAIISNIEAEHLDYFKGGIEEIKKHFLRFCRTIKPGGTLVYCADDNNTVAVVKSARLFFTEQNITAVSYGFCVGADYRISDYRIDQMLTHFSIKDSHNKYRVIAGFTGKHFARNATAAFALATQLGVNEEVSLAALVNYRGARRRMEFITRSGNISFYDDYAHHPSEVSATLEAFCQLFPKTRKFLIFEPHQQQRFNDLFSDFAEVFKKAGFDRYGLLPVYRVEGRDSRGGKTSIELAKKLGDGQKYFPLRDYNDAVNYLKGNLKSGDIVVTMGATAVDQVIRMYLKDKKNE